MIAAALTGVGVMLAAFGFIRLRTLDLAQRMDPQFDTDAALVAHFGMALLIGAGVGLVAFGWLAR